MRRKEPRRPASPGLAAGLLAACVASASAGRERAGAGLRPHLGPVTSVVATPSGLAACSQAGIAWPAPPIGGDATADVRPSPFRTFALAALADGQLLAAGGVPARTGEVALLRAPGTVVAHRVLAADVCYAVAVAPDHRRAVVGAADGRLHTLSLPDLAALAVAAAHTAPCRAVAWAPDGSFVASAGLDGVVRVEAEGGGVLRLVDHTAPVECLAIAPGSDRIASGAHDGKVRVHGRDGRLRRTFLHLRSEVLALAWRDEARLVAGTSDGRVLALVDAGDGEVREIGKMEAAVHALACAGANVGVGTRGRLVTLTGVLP